MKLSIWSSRVQPINELFQIETLLKNKNLSIAKVIYLLDLTDVHDEANRWEDIGVGNPPVISDKNVEREIKIF